VPKQDKVQIINQRRRKPTDSLGLGSAVVGGGPGDPDTITLETDNSIGETHTHKLDIDLVELGHIILIAVADGSMTDYGVAEDDTLTAALAAAEDCDVVWLPACEVSGDHTVPAGVTLRGLGLASVLTGALWLEDGASVATLAITRTASGSDDLVGLLGPDSGEATARDVHVSLVHMGTGKALGVLGMGGTLYCYGCEVWVLGGDGSAWAAASADAGEVELNQGQVLAWRTIWGS